MDDIYSYIFTTSNIILNLAVHAGDEKINICREKNDRFIRAFQLIASDLFSLSISLLIGFFDSNSIHSESLSNVI